MKINNLKLVLLIFCFQVNSNANEIQHISLTDPNNLEEVSTNILNRPISLAQGYGEVKFPIAIRVDSNSKALTAQKYFNQGWAMAGIFQYVDAVRSFKEVIKLDPNSIMARVGLILTYPNIGRSIAGAVRAGYIAAEAQMIAKKVSVKPEEILWLEVAVQLLGKENPSACSAAKLDLGDDRKTSEDKLINALSNLNKHFRKNPEAKVFLAWMKINGHADGWQFLNISPAADLESVASENSNNPGAHHYLVHIYENTGDFKKAELHARQLAELAPSSAHAQHMYGHILPQVGNSELAVDYFKKSDVLHQEWIKQNSADSDDDWHYAHNLELLGSLYLQRGENRLAREAFTKRCTARPFYFTCRSIIELELIESNPDAVLKTINELVTLSAGERAMLNEFLAEASILKGSEKSLKSLISKYDLSDRISPGVLFFAYKEGSISKNDYIKFLKSQVSQPGFDGWARGSLFIMRNRALAIAMNDQEMVREFNYLLEN